MMPIHPGSHTKDLVELCHDKVEADGNGSVPLRYGQLGTKHGQVACACST